MSPYRQLLLGILSVFLVATAGIEAIYYANARDALRTQLAAHSQDAATALGLVLGAAVATEDAVLAETMVAALFDRGYYSEIHVRDVRGNTLVRRQLTPPAPDVPDWFARMADIEAPAAQSPITAGWRQAGQVSVSSLPGNAYRQLWDTMLAVLVWLALLALSAACLLPHSCARSCTLVHRNQSRDHPFAIRR